MTDQTQSTSQVSAALEKESPKPLSAAQHGAEIIAYRKTCDAEGTGLSHYILMDKRTER